MTPLRNSGIAALLVALLVVPISAARAQRPVEVAPNAPADRPVVTTARCQFEAMLRAIEPYVARARASFPGARERFDAGLPPRHTFFVITRLRDAAGREEQVFVAVDSIVGTGERTLVAGRIWSDIHLVRGYRVYQPYTLPVGALVDWMIARPDGSEEGNVVGKFLDTYTPPATCADSVPVELTWRAHGRRARATGATGT